MATLACWDTLSFLKNMKHDLLLYDEPAIRETVMLTIQGNILYTYTIYVKSCVPVSIPVFSCYFFILGLYHQLFSALFR